MRGLSGLTKVALNSGMVFILSGVNYENSAVILNYPENSVLSGTLRISKKCLHLKVNTKCMSLNVLKIAVSRVYSMSEIADIL